MPIPKFDELFNDILEFLSDKKEYKTRVVKEELSKLLDLTDEERHELLPSGTEPIINNRIGWSISTLKKAGYVESQKWGSINITEEGFSQHAKNPEITIDDLMEIPEVYEWFNGKPKDKPKEQEGESTPEEEIEKSLKQINDSLADSIIENILNNDPFFFEKLVVDLLLKMGYGEFGRVTSPTNDGGIDGIINEDRLGINKIAIQAKRFSKGNVIGRPEIHKFAGALNEKGLSKGVFITTSSFTRDAISSAKHQSIVLIDGEKLANLMIEYNVGTFTSHTYEIKKIDSDYFNIDG
ncbi:MAG: restriction endonuclease [Methanobrevibacter sp.]|nr:restriction endonuclease [Methanobrevibacter sp.]MBR6516103.1 restriction endonuclease [Bacilli bacterium]